MSIRMVVMYYLLIQGILSLIPLLALVPYYFEKYGSKDI